MNNQYQHMNPMQCGPNTNKIYVVSKADAEQRYAPPNSYGVYFDQDKPILYEVYTGWDGKKITETYSLTRVNEDPHNGDLRAEFAQFKDEIRQMIQGLGGNANV